MERNSKTKIINWSLILGFTGIAASLWLAQSTNLDLAIQHYLFNFQNKTWLIDRDEPIKKFLFYTFPKLLFGITIGSLIGALIYARKTNSPNINHRKIFLTLLGLCLIPLTVGNIKKFTNIYCPNQLEIYHGKYPYVKIFDSYPKAFVQEKHGECYPAGHAVTGFALMILFFVFEKKSHQIFGLLAGISAGWILGFYQMAKGAHFFSDTSVSMFCCFFVAAIITKFFKRSKPYAHTPC